MNRTILLVALCCIFKMFVCAQTDTTLEVRVTPNENCLEEAYDFATGLEMTDEDTCYSTITYTVEQYCQLEHDLMTTGYFIDISTSEPEEENPEMMQEPPKADSPPFTLEEPYEVKVLQWKNILGTTVNEPTIPGYYFKVVLMSNDTTKVLRFAHPGN